MTIKQIAQSHVDHGLTVPQILWVLQQTAPYGTICVQTLMMPEELGTAPCALFGPTAGDGKIPECEVSYVVRGDRKGRSRMLSVDHKDYRRTREFRLVTIVTGPNEDDGCVLYTAYGGPEGKQECFESDSDESKEFWKHHALSR